MSVTKALHSHFQYHEQSVAKNNSCACVQKITISDLFSHTDENILHPLNTSIRPDLQVLFIVVVLLNIIQQGQFFY